MCRPLAWLAAVAVLVVGCGETTIDPAKVEELIRRSSVEPTAIASVECPEGRKAKKNDTFECTIRTKDGSEEVVTVRQLDEDGTVRTLGSRQTKLGPEARNLTLRAENAAALVKSSARDPAAVREAKCPSGVKLRKGDTFKCRLYGKDGSESVVTLIQVDALGNIRVASAKTVKRGR